MEIYSIDEAFLDLSSIKNENLLEHCYKIRKTILRWTGIPTSIGIAATKTLSKAANHLAKKEKSGIIDLVNSKKIDKFLSEIKINDVWGVGRQLTKLYIKNGINTEVGERGTFLSGGQTELEATKNLNEINIINDSEFIMTYSYGRALQQSALKFWSKDIQNIKGTQNVFNHRANMCSLAAQGKWSEELEAN